MKHSYFVRCMSARDEETVVAFSNWLKLLGWFLRESWKLDWLGIWVEADG